MEFISYDLTCEMVCLGERIKKGTFRSTIDTIPYTQITGALKAIFGKDKEIHAAGHIDNYESKEYAVYAPTYRTGGSRLPLIVEYLKGVKGKIFIVKNEDAENIFKNRNEINIGIGAMRSKGFGDCRLVNRKIINAGIKPGELKTRIPIEVIDKFQITLSQNIRYGYLFKPTSESSGVYIKSVFEGSEVHAPEVLIEQFKI